MVKKVNILGINYTKIGYSELLKEIQSNLGKNKLTISVIAVDPVMISRKKPHLKKIYNSFNYVLADSFHVVLASRLLRNPLPGRISGPDIFPNIVDLCSQKGFSIFFLGSDEETIKKVKEKLSKKNALVKGHYCPPIKEKFGPKDNQIMVKKINKAKPDFLFVTLGAPKQDIWIQENKNKVNAKVIMGIGAAFDFYAGTIRRAPKLMRNVGLEWLFRLVQEPKRLWKRYARDLLFPILIIKELIKR